MRRLFLASWSLLIVARVTEAAPCSSTGSEPPAVPTLMASKSKPAREAWIVSPSCDVQVLALVDSEGYTRLDVVDPAVARVISLPSDTTLLALSGTAISAVEPAMVPQGLRLLTLGDNKQLTTMENLDFPSSLTTLECGTCHLRTIRGCRFPASMNAFTIFSVTQDPLEIELQETDFGRLKSFMRVSTSARSGTCSDRTARLEIINRISVASEAVCVISDAQFTKRYRQGANAQPAAPVSTTSAPPKDSGSSGSGGGTTAAPSPSTKSPSTTTIAPGSQSGSPSPSSNAPSPSNSSDIPLVNSGQSSRSSSDSVDSGTGEDLSSRPTGRPRTSSEPSTIQPPAKSTTKASSSSTPVVAIAVGGGIAAVLVLLLAFRLYARSRSGAGDGEEDKQTTQADQSNSGGEASSTLGYFTNDVRNDRALQAKRLDEREIRLGRVIARGGFGVIYKAEYRGQVVVVKRMLPGKWRDDKVLAQFLGEIRLSASLDHARIVSFLGVTWTSLADVAAVIEFMAGGDLHAALRHHRSDWLARWAGFKAKLAMACDIAEGVAYLHAFETPIIHRDLKAKNVLLDRRGNAKLSDFGISREIELSQTMTGEVGTAAWIAPEVLRGERYGVEADVYSFGVLLVELDKCTHPYVGFADHTSDRGILARGAQIAMLVSTGRLRPEPSADCPAVVRQLVDECVAFDHAKRPSTNEIFERLNKFATEECDDGAK